MVLKLSDSELLFLKKKNNFEGGDLFLYYETDIEKRVSDNKLVDNLPFLEPDGVEYIDYLYEFNRLTETEKIHAIDSKIDNILNVLVGDTFLNLLYNEFELGEIKVSREVKDDIITYKFPVIILNDVYEYNYDGEYNLIIHFHLIEVLNRTFLRYYKL